MEILLPFARLEGTDKVVAVEEVPRGKNCRCECLFCDAPMSARKGEENRHHFAHQAREVDEDKACIASFERCLFWMARRILSESRQITLPAYELNLVNTTHQLHERHTVTPSRILTYDAVEFPNPMESFDRDTAVLKIGGYSLVLSLFFNEVAGAGGYHHDGKMNAHLALTMKSFDLLFKQEKKGFKTLMNERLLTSELGKEWLYHPNEKPYRQAFFHQIAVYGEERLKRDAVRKMNAQRRNERLAAESRAVTTLPEKDKIELARQSFGLNVTRAAHEARIKELVAIVLALKEAGVAQGNQCNLCKVMYADHPGICRHCAGGNFDPIELTDEYTYSLEHKYLCWNYASLSIKVAPLLTSQ